MFIELVEARDDKDALVVTAIVEIWHGYDSREASTIHAECITSLSRSVYEELPPSSNLDAVEDFIKSISLDDSNWEPIYS